MPDQTTPKQPLGLWIIKILFIGIILIVGAIILFGFVLSDFDPIEFIFNILGLLLMLALLALAIKGLVAYIKPKPFSPTESFRDQLIRICLKSKPFNVKDLHLRGEDMRTSAKWGRIRGLGFLPYISSGVLKDKKGKILFEKDEAGKIVYTKTWSHEEKQYIKVPKPKTEMITHKDGDVLLLVDKHRFPLSLFFRGYDIIRANKKYLSDLIGDIYIKDVNLVPYGEFLYPSKQWQESIIGIMKENESQTIVTTHRDNLDLVSLVTQMSLGADPTFQKIILAQSERLSSGMANPGGGQ